MVVIVSFPALLAVGLHAGAHHADWRKNYPIGLNPDCQATDLDIPFGALFTTGGASALCDFSASTCTISSLVPGPVTCPECRCGTTLPAQYQVVIAGHSCANNNGTYILSPEAGTCSDYTLSLDAPTHCDNDRIRLQVLNTGYRVDLMLGGSSPGGVWIKGGYDTPRGCNESGLVLQSGGTIGTCTITAI